MKKLFNIFLFLFAVNFSWAQDSLNISIVGNLNLVWDQSHDIVVTDNYAYIASGETGLRIMDISEFPVISEISHCETQGKMIKIFLSDHYIYAAEDRSFENENYGGLAVIDVSNPFLPDLVAYTETVRNAVDLVVYENYAYVVNQFLTGGLNIFDVSDPRNPNLIGFYQTPISASCVDLKEGYAIVGDVDILAPGFTDNTLQIIDVQNPMEPFLAGDCDLPSSPSDVRVEAGLAYVATVTEGLRIIDITNPANPQETGFYDIPTNTRCLDLYGGYVYTGGLQMYIINPVDPANPVLISSFDCISTKSLDVFEDIVFIISNNQARIQLVDVNNPVIPTEIRIVDFIGEIVDVDISGNRAYLATEHSGLREIDLSNIENPLQSGIYQPESHFFSSLAEENGYTYVSDVYNGLHVVDVNQPGNPMLLGLMPGSEYRDIHVQNQYAYLAAGSDGLVIVDISEAENPTVVSTTPVSSSAWGVTVEDDYAYVSDVGNELLHISGCLIIYNISDPFMPWETGSVELPYWSQGLDIFDNHAYVANREEGLLIIDVSNPDNPVEVATFTRPDDNFQLTHAYDVKIAQNHAFLAYGNTGLIVLDINDPLNPVESGYYNTAGLARGVQVQNSYAYLADTHYFEIFDCSLALGGNNQDRLEIPLEANYFELVSSPIIPENPDAAVVFAEVENLEIVYQNDGSIFIPPNNNTIGDLDFSQAYYIYCNHSSELHLNGELLDPLTEYSVNGNSWSWIGYPFNYPVPVETALDEISDLIQIVLSDDGRFWIPGFINTLGNLLPGEGYIVFSSEEATFQYHDEAFMKEIEPGELWPVQTEYSIPEPTGFPYLFLLNIEDKLKNQNAALIEIYDNDQIVGKGDIIKDKTLTPVISWRQNLDYSLPGYTPGHEAIVRVIDHQGNTLAEDHSAKFGMGAYAHLTLVAESLPMEYSVSKAYPNPFNPSTNIFVTIPRAGILKVQIYSLTGQRVFESRSQFSPGIHQINLDLNSINDKCASGMYFVNTVYNNEIKTQKILFLK